MMSNNENAVLKEINVRLLHQGKQVFYGKIKELPSLMARDQDADRAQLYGENGMAVASMNYQYLKSIIENEFPE